MEYATTMLHDKSRIEVTLLVGWTNDIALPKLRHDGNSTLTAIQRTLCEVHDVLMYKIRSSHMHLSDADEDRLLSLYKLVGAVPFCACLLVLVTCFFCLSRVVCLSLSSFFFFLPSVHSN